ncbi:MAG TPA: molybdenum cofactor biosynthesis protein MoaE [Gemmatimonadales bacterium]|nr:molybdenum cofactor biosynthesis protein MoaE [Gemmatimonadales bacterium]
MMDHLTRNPISIEALLAIVQSPERGGTCVFLGTVRSDDDVTGIDYSAYDEMAVAEITRILEDAHNRWTDARVILQHRLGLVPLGEASIGIAAAAPHRDEAFAACRYVIEEVKKRLPVWKKELHADGTTTWVDPSGKQVAGGMRDL